MSTVLTISPSGEPGSVQSATEAAAARTGSVASVTASDAPGAITQIRPSPWTWPVGDSEEMTVADTVEDPLALTDTALIESAALEELLTALQEIDPDGRRIGELLLEGNSRNDISKILHIGTSTFYKRFDRLRAQLRKRLGEFF